MRCPYCKADNDRVIDSRASDDGFAIRRRRLCQECNRRTTTYERAESTPLRVVKKNGARVAFDRTNILGGLLKACEKRSVSSVELDGLVDRVERQCLEAFDKEVPSKVIGKLIMDELRQLDQVAYVRFASVYREFKDVAQFLEELKPMLEGSQGPQTTQTSQTTQTTQTTRNTQTTQRVEGADHETTGGVLGQEA